MRLIRLPAEWEPQTAIMLTWPHEKGDWGMDYTAIESVFLDIAKAVASSQNVVIVAYDVQHQRDIIKKLSEHQVNLQEVIIFIAPSNDAFTRDHGPITIHFNDQAIFCDFTFNAWGGKYPSKLDDQICATLFNSDALPGYYYQKIDFVLEGGSIESDGQGTLLTTKQCLLHPQRNTNLSMQEIEDKLKHFLGIENVLWLDSGHILGDDTDGHIDTLARFINPATIAYVQCENPDDPHYQALSKMHQTLQSFRNKANQPYHLVPLPLPDPIFDQKGNPLPATYANFLITNDKVLVPLYQDRHDEVVLELLTQYFPTRKVVGINARPAIEQFGSLHCLTMQIPKPPHPMIRGGISDR